MKKLMVLALLLVFMGGKSQNDSLPRFKFSGVQPDIQGITNFGGSPLERQKLLGFVNDDPLLTTDLSGYSSWSNGTYIEYNGSVGFKVFATSTKKRKYVLDIFAGLYFGSSSSHSRSYYKTTYDTVNVYTGTNGKKLYEINRNDDDYLFSLSSSQITLPLGLSINTNKQKRFWASAGLCIAPGLKFNYHYISSNFLVTTSYISDDNNLQANYYGLGPTQTKFKPIVDNHRKLNEIGFVGYISTPLSLNMRLSKKIKFLKHLNASITLSPAYYVNIDKIVGSSHRLAMVSNVGLRYNL